MNSAFPVSWTRRFAPYWRVIVSILWLCAASVSLAAIETQSDARRIIGGEAVAAQQWPWMAALVLRPLEANAGQICGATLVHARWALTAAHCFDRFWITSPNAEIDSGLGEKAQTFPQLSDDAFDIVIGRDVLAEESMSADEDAVFQTVTRIAVDQVILHPGYQVGSHEFDVALLHLAEASHHVTVKLADQFSQLDTAGRFATVLGWGAIDSHAGLNPVYPEQLQQAVLPLVSRAQCNAPDIFNGMIKETMLCAGYIRGEVDTCTGDSGGPLLAMGTRGWQQIGLTSFGLGCGQANTYGVYTRISSVLPFIEQHVCANDPFTQTLPPHVDLHTFFNGDSHNLELTWSVDHAIEGYRMVFAPYVIGQKVIPLSSIRSLDLGKQTSLRLKLSEAQYYLLTFQTYLGNCKGPYSPLLLLSPP